MITYLHQRAHKDRHIQTHVFSVNVCVCVWRTYHHSHSMYDSPLEKWVSGEDR